MVGETAREVAKVGDRLENLHGALQKVCMTACSGPDEFWQRNQLKPAGLQGSMLYKVRKFCNSKHLDSASVFDVSVFSLWCPAQETKLWRGQRSSFSACPSSFLLSSLSVSLFSVIVTMNWSWRVDVSLWLNMIRMPAACWTIFLNAAVNTRQANKSGNFTAYRWRLSGSWVDRWVIWSEEWWRQSERSPSPSLKTSPNSMKTKRRSWRRCVTSIKSSFY